MEHRCRAVMVADGLPVSEVALRYNRVPGLVARRRSGGIRRADGRESKMLSGIDDRSRFAVCAAALAVRFLRAVADTFAAVTRTRPSAGYVSWPRIRT